MSYLNHHWRYKNLTMLALSFIVAIWLSGYEPFHQFLFSLGKFGYIGAFIAGALFVSSFTAATGAIILLVLAEKLSPIEVALLGGLGGVMGDMLIFRFIKDSLMSEISDIYGHFDEKRHFIKILHSKYFAWTLPVFGALIIASPFPDEIGVSLIGISKMSTKKFLVISFILDVIGVSFIVSLSPIIKP